MNFTKTSIISLGLSLSAFSATTEELFQLGMQESQAGNVEQAVVHFRKALKKSSSPRIKLELALAEEQLGHSDEAEQLYKEVLASNPPANVKANIQKRLEVVALAKKRGVERKVVKTQTGEERKVTVIKPKRWSGDFSLGFFYDDNVNAGPEADSVLIFDLPFVLSPDAQAQEDGGYQVKANFQYRHPSETQASWLTSVGYSRTGYFENHRFDHDSFRLSTARQWADGKNQYSIPLQYSLSLLGGDLYTQSVSTSPTVYHKISPEWTSISSVYLAKNFNAQVDGRDGESAVFNQSFRWTSKDKKYFVQPRFFVGKEFADANTLASDQFGFSVGAYAANLPGEISLYVEPSIRHTRYGAVDPLFGERREGTQFSLSVNATRRLPWWDMDVALGYTYTKNSSNIDLYDYDRNQVSLLLRKEF